VIDDQEAPKAQHRDVNYVKLATALLIEGALFALIRGVVDHGAVAATRGSPAAGQVMRSQRKVTAKRWI
jgi:hypothetical protein